MAIKEGDFVKLNYTGSVEGTIFDTTSEEVAKENGTFSEGKEYKPIVIRVGGNHVIPGLDEDLAGKEAGQEYEIVIPPEKAYGDHDSSLVKSVPTNEFKEKPAVGMRVTADGRQGVVANVVGKRAVIDFNHMLAGQTLNYKYTIEGVVEDSVEQAGAVFDLFVGRELEMSLEDGVLTVILPPGITYDQRYMMGKGMAVHQIFEFVEEINEVVLKESFKRPEKAEPVEEAAEKSEE
ncbi:peptidylprolyl isomerase [Methanoplanus sp. FWC-SCC4]|uniref:Peptidyl-prolyl cis-trans isomerase n=1 Tax=Methanochimaera problematica TaxID=2609417 RepID=A0AA97FCB7_9EURY|nr:peptidylprolyl isomerase [Methanoplanus sp. FWC-SCC4]WOF15604.1 peptidylprolyl isomerase [Methanoplanus sp. FWC-SCC4]